MLPACTYLVPNIQAGVVSPYKRYRCRSHMTPVSLIYDTTPCFQRISRAGKGLQTVGRVDLNEGCFLGFFRYFPEISVFLGFSLQENTEISGKY